jgi:hypothetical protein
MDILNYYFYTSLNYLNQLYLDAEYKFWVKVVPVLTGKPVMQGWDPQFVRKHKFSIWNPYSPREISYYKFKYLHNQYLNDYGLERSKEGVVRRLISPQMIYADPRRAHQWGPEALQYYLKNRREYIDELRQELTLNPFAKSNSIYYKNVKWNDMEILSYNIQSHMKFFNYNIDAIEVLLTIIFFLVLILFYFIFYHLYKLNLRLKEAEYLLNEHGLMKSEEELSAQEMQDAWREGGHTSEAFDLGIEMDYCLYEGSLVGFELFIIMALSKIHLVFIYVYTKIYNFYFYNMELFTYIFFYIFTFLSIYYWIRYRIDKRNAFYKWIMIDYHFTQLMSHLCRTFAWVHLYKLMSGVDIYFFIIVYMVAISGIYLACDACDYFMGWNQEYRRDIYYKHTGIKYMHWYWPRILMNQTWQHFISVLVKGFHKWVIYSIFAFILPCLALYNFIEYIENKLHAYISNKFFFWNRRKYTIEEVKEQWLKDKVHNYIVTEKEKRNQRRGLIIL